MRLDHIPTEALVDLLMAWIEKETIVRHCSLASPRPAVRKHMRECYQRLVLSTNELYDELRRRIIALEASQGHVAEEEEGVKING